MPEGIRIIGSARTAQSREVFLAKVKDWMQQHVDDALFSEEKWERFSSKLFFAQADATNPESLGALKGDILGEGNQLVVYLAIPPLIFGKVCASLDACGLAGENTRLVVEKPLGDSR